MGYYYNIFMQINRINFFDKIIIVIVFISLGGIPPILGFLRKLLILKIIFSALILLYHYISRIYFFLTYVPSMKFGLNYTNNSRIKYLYLISLVIFTLNLLF